MEEPKDDSKKLLASGASIMNIYDNLIEEKMCYSEIIFSHKFLNQEELKHGNDEFYETIETYKHEKLLREN